MAPMTKVLYPGSFDPIHNGHLDIIEVAARRFDEVVVAAVRNPQKGEALFDLDERQAMIAESAAHLPNVSVTLFASLVVDLARRRELALERDDDVGELRADLPRRELAPHDHGEDLRERLPLAVRELRSARTASGTAVTCSPS